MPLKIFIDYSSQPCLAVLTLAKLKKIGYQAVEIDLFKQQHLTENFAKINPFKKVPALFDQENNFKTSESHAIMRYLCRVKPDTFPNMYPNSDINRATKIDEYLEFHHLGVRHALSDYIYSTCIMELMGKYDEKFDLVNSQERVKKALTQFEDFFMIGDYIVGSELSIADLSAYFEIDFLILAGFDFSKWERILKWMKRLENNFEPIDEARKSLEVVLKGFQSGFKAGFLERIQIV